jgi:hypothetical protein
MAMRRALTSSSRLCSSRRLLSTAAPAQSWSQWFDQRKPRIIQVLLSGISVCVTGHAVNVRNRSDEMEAELTEQLRLSASARQVLLQQAPVLARELGMPQSAEEKFKAALLAVDQQQSSGSATSAALDAQEAAMQSSGAPLKQAGAAVW